MDCFKTTSKISLFIWWFPHGLYWLPQVPSKAFSQGEIDISNYKGIRKHGSTTNACLCCLYNVLSIVFPFYLPQIISNARPIWAAHAARDTVLRCSRLRCSTLTVRQAKKMQIIPFRQCLFYAAERANVGVCEID